MYLQVLRGRATGLKGCNKECQRIEKYVINAHVHYNRFNRVNKNELTLKIANTVALVVDNCSTFVLICGVVSGSKEKN